MPSTVCYPPSPKLVSSVPVSQCVCAKSGVIHALATNSACRLKTSLHAFFCTVVPITSMSFASSYRRRALHCLFCGHCSLCDPKSVYSEWRVPIKAFARVGCNPCVGTAACRLKISISLHFRTMMILSCSFVSTTRSL